MLRARLLEGSSSKAWVDKVPGIMLALNAMPHEPHGFSASMVATGREPALPPDVHQDAHASPAVDDPSDYIEMASPSPPSVANPYQEGSLIYAMTTPPPPPPRRACLEVITTLERSLPRLPGS